MGKDKMTKGKGKGKGKGKFLAPVFLMAFLLTIVFAGPVYGEFTEGDFTYTVNDDDEAMITGYTGPGGHLDIPATLGGYPVRIIGFEAFRDKSLTSVTLPDGLRQILYGAFHMNMLETIDIPDSVTSMWGYAFADNALESVIFSENLNYISLSTFYNNNLSSFIIPEHVTYIGSAAFQDNQLESVVLHDNITHIEADAFNGNQLTSISLGSGLTDIEPRVFANNLLESVVIPGNINRIREEAFANNQLTSVDLGSATSIEFGAFYQNLLSAVDIPGTVTWIGTSAFQDNLLTTVTIPDSVTELGDDAFRENQITSAIIPGSVINIGSDVFALNQLDPADLTIYGEVGSAAQTYAQNYGHSFVAMEGGYIYTVDGTNAEIIDYIGIDDSISIPATLGGLSVTSIGEGAFREKGLTSVAIPDSVTTIGPAAFFINDIVSLTLGSNVATIGTSAFSNNGLTSVTIPDSVTLIGNGAFRYNILTSVRIGKGVETIEAFAFQGNQLDWAVIPSSVLNINSGAFADNQANSHELFIYGVHGTAAWTYAHENHHTFADFLSRVYGPNRFATAVAISQAGWQAGADTVVLARGDDFADALAGVPLAYQLDAPILLTRTDRTVAATMEEIERLGADRVILLGGPGAISEAVEDELTGLGLSVERIAGANRYATAALIAERLRDEGVVFSSAFIAVGTDFADALAASSYAAIMGQPILLTQTNRLANATGEALTELGITSTVVCGGAGAISETVFDLLPNPQRISGQNRYETAVALAEAFLPAQTMHVGMATGLDFPDAIAGGVLTAKFNCGVLLVRGTRNEPNDVVKDFLEDRGLAAVALFGGKGVISAGMEDWLEDELVY